MEVCGYLQNLPSVAQSYNSEAPRKDIIHYKTGQGFSEVGSLRSFFFFYSVFGIIAESQTLIYKEKATKHTINNNIHKTMKFQGVNHSNRTKAGYFY